VQNLAETHSKKDFEIDSFISAIRFFEKSLQREIKFDKIKNPILRPGFFFIIQFSCQNALNTTR
jgi:hypothetical protein